VKGLGAALAFAAFLVVGCGRASGEPARYDGRLGVPPVSVADVRVEPSRPPEYELLGEVKARCRADDGAVELDGEMLADVDCSDALLRAALQEKAASVGGELLVGLRCDVSAQHQGDLFGSELHTCSARVAAPRSAVKRDVIAPPSQGPYASPGQSFDVKVSLRPDDPNAQPRHAVPSERVAELAYVPPGRVVLGDIVARCREGCDRAVVRHAVRAAAGRVGASDVVGVACVQRHDGWLCTGRATRPEIDEYAAR
jgi:hypothetical protein